MGRELRNLALPFCTSALSLGGKILLQRSATTLGFPAFGREGEMSWVGMGARQGGCHILRIRWSTPALG